jgi:C4-dicarboxylate-specific signal transduction histidine kinase
LKIAPIGTDDKQRLESLSCYEILDTDSEKEFDDLTQLAAHICDTPIALISLVDANRQWFKAKVGVNACETPRDISFCGHAIQQEEVFIVPDALLDERFSDNPLVTGPLAVRFYAGVPLQSASGYMLGTLCVIDHLPRELTSQQIFALKTLARQVVSLLELRKTSRRLIDTFHYMDDALVMLSSEGKVIEYNSAALKILNVSDESFFHQNLLQPQWKVIKENGELFPENEYPWDLAMKTGLAQKHVAMGLEIEPDVFKWILVTSIPQNHSQAQNPYRVTTHFSDITNRKMTTNELIYSSKMAALGEMAGSVAHEMNTPLGVISAKNELLLLKRKKGTLTLEHVESELVKINSTVDRLANIIRGLISFSRKTKHDDLSECSINSIIQDTLELCDLKFKKENIKLLYAATSDLMVKCRSSEISQILLNLLTNACHAIEHRPDKWIQLRVVQEEQNILLHVIDCGEGIPKSVVEKMMEPFFTTKPIGVGTGLGLSISRGLAEAQGGKLEYKEVDEHTCFTLSLPLGESQKKIA